MINDLSLFFQSMSRTFKLNDPNKLLNSQVKIRSGKLQFNSFNLIQIRVFHKNSFRFKHFGY